MHELSYISRVVNMALEIAEKNGAKKVKQIVIEIGKTSGVMPYYMHKYYPDVVKNTVLENAELICEEVPVKALCEECGKEYYPDKNNNYLCPLCNGRKAHIISGRGVSLKNIVIEE